jgi:DNA-binding response OmpR family regulator
MKILLVEDQAKIAKYIKQGLEAKSYVVDLAQDGQTGCDLACAEKYDLIILDRMLPKLSGLELCRELREYDQQTPILMLTAKTDVEDRVEGLQAGADDYLGKPFAFAELLARIQALTRRQDKPVAEVIKIDNLIIDTTNYTAARAGQELELSPKEYALLDFLARNKGQTVSALQLVERVWSYESDVLANTAQVYLGYLRKKIDKDFPDEKPLIKTVRGFGYKLTDE